MRKQFAVIGNPIEQSRSPELHHAFAEKTGIDLQYSKRLAPLDGFRDSVADFFNQGGVGMNVTVPFKEQAFAQCGVLTERAKIAKAVNTLWMQDGVLHGDNTDGQSSRRCWRRSFRMCGRRRPGLRWETGLANCE